MTETYEVEEDASTYLIVVNQVDAYNVLVYFARDSDYNCDDGGKMFDFICVKTGNTVEFQQEIIWGKPHLFGRDFNTEGEVKGSNFKHYNLSEYDAIRAGQSKYPKISVAALEKIGGVHALHDNK